MLLPHRNLLIATSLWLICAFASIWLPALQSVWMFSGILLLMIVLADAWLIRSTGNPLTIERRLAQIWPVGVEQTITLRLRTEDRASVVHGQIHDASPPAFTAEPMPMDFYVRPGQWLDLSYRLTPDERGAHAFGHMTVRLVSPFRLWLCQHRTDCPETVRVFPNFARITQYALLATDNRLSQMGVLRRRRRGEGSDFAQLREYRQDDSLRNMDWKATARLRKPIVREYQDERDQQIIFLLDCGQRMRSRDGALSHFDHTLNAMLLLSYVALRQGDAVGFCTFSQAAPRYFAARKSVASVQHLLNATYDLQPGLQTSDYLAASELFTQHVKKRSLVILLTNLRDEDDATLLPALQQLRQRHLVLTVSLRETALDTLLNTPVENFDDALTYAAAVDYKRARQTQLARLRAGGIQLLETAPAQLPVALVNRYWEMKRSGTI